MSVVIETRGLTKVYEGALKGQDVLALNKLDIAIESGEIFGFLGPNGSGKTTTIKLLLGLIFPTAGSIEILGRKDIGSASVKRLIGYLPEGAYYPDFLRGEEVLRFYGQLYGIEKRDLARRIDRVLEVVGMTRARKRLIRGYSKGMRQRIGLAQALLSDPQILILDEPTTGLDPIARKEIRDILSDLRDQGKTLFISSHELLEVELISNRVGILFEGSLQIMGTIDTLLTDRDYTVRASGASETALEHLGSAGIKTDDLSGSEVVLRIPTGMALFDVFDRCKAEQVTIVSVEPRRETLEELFVRVVGDAQKREEQAK